VALGEATYGKGKGFERILVLTLGTGLGVGFVRNGKFQDELPYAHMAGHISITDNDHRCYCGKTGCLESLVSSSGIIYAAEKINLRNKYAMIPLTAESIFVAAKDGNRDAQSVVKEWLRYLEIGIHNYINLYAPDIIVIGGGIAKGIQPYLGGVTVNNDLKPFKNYTMEIVISELHEHAGILGSAALMQE
jgi:glucokinase